MTHTINILLQATRLELLFYFRHREALFFTCLFPLFLLIIFGTIWSAANLDPYILLLTTGILGMAISSEAFFSIGPVLRIYRDYNILKLFHVLPFNPILHFVGFIISRLAAIFISVTAILLTGILVFQVPPNAVHPGILSLSMVLGALVFGLLGLIVSFHAASEAIRPMLNAIYFPMLFLGATFFPLDAAPAALRALAMTLPLTHLNLLIRGEMLYSIHLIGWILFCAVALQIILRMKKSEQVGII